MSSHEAHKARPASSSSCRRLKARTGLRTLREAGYAVVECGSGEEAVALCRSKAPIDVLFTDINLSGLVSGWEVAERFRMDRPDGVVLYTSANGVDPKRCCPDSVFLAKPYLHCDILSVCERLRTK